MHLLALDIGTRRTGIAFVDTDVGVPLPLDTLVFDSQEEMVHAVTEIARERSVNQIVIGLPLLPSGEEGSQVDYVRSCAEDFIAEGFEIVFLDERYTTSPSGDYDGDARAACELLALHLKKSQF
jgi:putative transcription antitermination factor YqgF